MRRTPFRRKPSRRSAREASYNAWLTGLPCALTGRTQDMERAHTGRKSMGAKPPTDSILPLARPIHAAQEHCPGFFAQFGIENHLECAADLYAAFLADDRDAAEDLLADMHRRAMAHNRAGLEAILREAGE